MSVVVCVKCGENCYAKLLNEVSAGPKIYDEQKFCGKCNAHLTMSGICLNACHLSDASLSRFTALFDE